jgi:hypothetical protein
MTEVDSRCGALLAADLAFWAGVGALIYKGSTWWHAVALLILLPLAAYCVVRLLGWAISWLASKIGWGRHRQEPV